MWAGGGTPWWWRTTAPACRRTSTPAGPTRWGCSWWVIWRGSCTGRSRSSATAGRPSPSRSTRTVSGEVMTQSDILSQGHGRPASPEPPAGREEALRLVAALVESFGDAIVGTDREGLITVWSGAAEAMLGYSAAEVLG